MGRWVTFVLSCSWQSRGDNNESNLSRLSGWYFEDKRACGATVERTERKWNKEEPGEPLTWREDHQGQLSRENHVQKVVSSSSRKSWSFLPPPGLSHAQNTKPTELYIFFFLFIFYFTIVSEYLPVCCHARQQHFLANPVKYFYSATARCYCI